MTLAAEWTGWSSAAPESRFPLQRFPVVASGSADRSTVPCASMASHVSFGVVPTKKSILIEIVAFTESRPVAFPDHDAVSRSPHKRCDASAD